MGGIGSGYNPVSHLNLKPGRKVGSRDSKTIITETLKAQGITDIFELKVKVLQVFMNALEGSNKNLQMQAAREVAKYLFSTTANVHMTGDVSVNFVGLEEMKQKAEEVLYSMEENDGKENSGN